MFRCSACSWLYVFPLNTVCTSVLTAVLMPSRRSPVNQKEHRRGINVVECCFPVTHTFVIHKGKSKENPSIELKDYVPGPFPEASSFLSLLISSSVMVVMSLQKSTFFPCSSSMYTYQHNNTPSVNNHRSQVVFGVNRHKIIRLYVTFYFNTFFTDFTFAS